MKERFSKFYRDDVRNEDRIATPGSQYLVQLLKGGYLGEDFAAGTGRRALDIGCGNGFNLVSLAFMGWLPYGCDISDEIVARARWWLEKFDTTGKVVLGTNRAIPYADGYFELLLSIHALHYAETEESVREAIAEYARVTAPGGRIIVQTIHPGSWLLKGSRRVGENLREIRRRNDYRRGETVHVFPTPDQAADAFSPYFTDLRVGVNQLDFVHKVVKSFVITGTRIRN